MSDPVRRWSRGEVVVRREVLGLDPIPRPEPHPEWYGQAWAVMPTVVVEDTDEHLVTYFAPGARFGFPPGDWPIDGGDHPWSRGSGTWEGNGTLMIQRPGDHFAVWHFWTGEDREFSCWYVNLQTAFVRTDRGFDTQDLELDVVVDPNGRVTVKDDDLLDVRVAEGRYTAELAAWVRELGADLVARLESGDWWFDRRWADWEPDPAWRDSELPPGWGR